MTDLLYIANVRLPTDRAYGIQIANMCDAFADYGMRVVLAVPTRNNPIIDDFFSYYGIRKSFKVARLLTPDFYLPGVFDRAAVLVKNFISASMLAVYGLLKSPDIIYSRDEVPLYLLSFFRKNIVFEAHKFSHRRRRFYKRFKNTGLNIITISEGLKSEFVAFGFAPEKVLVAHDGVNMDRFVVALSQQECRVRLGLLRGKMLVGYVGQLRTMGMEKGIGDLIKAFALVRRNGVDAALVIVGGTSADIAYYKKVAAAEGLGDDVIFAGRREHADIPLYLKSFDVLTMPFPYNRHYAHYMSPLKLFEYMASGHPIIASDLPTVREVLNSSNAILVPPDDFRAVAGALERIFNDPELGVCIGKEALRNCREYTWNKRAQKILFFIGHAS